MTPGETPKSAIAGCVSGRLSVPDLPESDLDPLLSALRDLLAWLRSERVDAVVIGGVAASLLGTPRTTADVDALLFVEDEIGTGFVESGRRWGIRPRIDDAVEFARRTRVLLLRHDASGVDIDISFGALPFEEAAVREARVVEVAGLRIPVPRVEDLLVMKAVAHRGRDLADIEGLLDANPDLDLDAVRAVVREFSEALEMPEILDDLEAAIRRSQEP
jgi:hypothetical protein